MEINTVNLVGRAGREPDVRYFESGSTVANFTLAVNRRRRMKKKRMAVKRTAGKPLCEMELKVRERNSETHYGGKQPEICRHVATGNRQTYSKRYDFFDRFRWIRWRQVWRLPGWLAGRLAGQKVDGSE